MNALTKSEIAQILKRPFANLNQKTLFVLRAYGDGRNCCKWNLTYGNQLEFKRVAHRYFGLNKNLFYFDGVSCVDAKTNKNIKGVKCNDSLQWGEAIDKIKAHFKI